MPVSHAARLPIRQAAGRRSRRAAEPRSRAATLLIAVVVLALAACEPRVEYEVSAIAGGDAERGRTAIRAYGCQTCHTIPGVPGADALVGPSLAGLATRAYVGGVLSNTPENLVMWIQDPKAASPRTAMPDVGVTPEDARDIASYLYTLR